MGIVTFYAFLYNIKCFNQNLLQSVQKYWMQPYSLQVLDVALHCYLYTKSFQCEQLSYNSINAMDAGIHAAKLKASAGCRQIVVSIGFSINFCIQSV